jgi:EAL domain-containing protein (putative c-di-GMP-specific phosphodiesterase class I)
MCSEAALHVLDEILVGTQELNPTVAGDILEAARLRLSIVISDVVERSAEPNIALQRIEHLGSGMLLGYEALARFGGGMSTVEYFRIAAELGIAVNLELVTLGAALERRDDVPDDVFLAVNLSAPALFDARIMEALSRADLRGLVVELTPQGTIDDVAGLRQRFGRLNEMGVTVAVDSAGVGFFQGDRLLEVRPEMIKIARSLVSGCDGDADKRQQLTDVIEIGRRIGALVIGVGVESARELEVLADLGVDAVQGNVIAHPVIDISFEHAALSH